MRLVAGVLGILLVTAAAPTGAAAVPAAPAPFQVMSWNMCGSQRSTWGCAGTGTPGQKLDVVSAHVRDDAVEAVLLQEVCEDDLALLMGRLGAGWSRSFFPYQWSQDGVRTGNRCGDDDGRADRIGTAIVARGALSGARLYPTTQPWTGQQRPFQCATATRWAVGLCNAHLSPAGSNPDHPEWEYADDQLAEITEVVAGFPDLVLGGDFNVNPPDWPGNARAWLWPEGLYSAGAGTAGYRECDQAGTERTGRATHDSGAKIDYLFSSEARRWCRVLDTAYSDHHVIIESVVVGW